MIHHYPNAAHNRERSPRCEVKEVLEIFFSNAIVSDQTMVVHEVDASVAATAVVDPGMELDALAFATRWIAVRGPLGDKLLAWNYVTGV